MQGQYQFKNIVIGGGGFVTGIVFSPAQKGLCYVRTDIGGAYRRSGPDDAWQPLMDWLGPEDWNLQGVESIMCDPKDPARVYAALGTYQDSWTGSGAICSSADQGRSWKRFDLPFKMGGNEAGRGNGERLAVDPRDGSRLLFGSRSAGLWRSLDYGSSWEPVESFPITYETIDASSAEPLPSGHDYRSQLLGIAQILYDRFSPAAASPRGEGASSRIWVAVSRHRDGLMESDDGGLSWKPIAGQPQGLRPICMDQGADGVLYVSYGRDPGPNTMGPGALWSYEPSGKIWKNITPELAEAEAGKILFKDASGNTSPADQEKAARAQPPEGQVPYGLGSVCADPLRPGRLICSTWHRSPSEELFLSEDGGASWRPLLAASRWDTRGMSYPERLKPHWISDACFDPFDTKRVMFTSGYGLWSCADLGAQSRLWYFDVRGIEETVPLALHSPADSPSLPRLLSGLGDIDGFIHEALDAAPPRDAGFDKPGWKNTECIQAAGRRPEVIVRTGTTYHYDKIHAAISFDRGRSWQALHSQPEPDPGVAHPVAAGPICIGADAEDILWCPRGHSPWHTSDMGRSWQRCGGLSGFMKVCADPDDPRLFYAWDTSSGIVHRSEDRGMNFHPVFKGFVVSPKPWGPVEGNLQCLRGIAGGLILDCRETLHVSRDGGSAWKELPGAKVLQYGLGCPSPGHDCPAIYIQGFVKGEYGIYRSDDLGQSWIRLNDSAQRFPSLRSITGDGSVPYRVYIATGGRGAFWGEPRGGGSLQES